MNSWKEGYLMKVFMVFNKYKVTVSRGVWEKGAWKIKGEFNTDNFITDI